MKKTRHYDLVHTLFVLFIIIMIFTRKRYTIIYQDFTNPMFLFFLFIFTIFSYWGLNHDRNDVKRATQRAVSGFIIAYLAHTDLMFVAYMVIWMFVFHTGDEWV
jgi:hypothetical protein